LALSLAPIRPEVQIRIEQDRRYQEAIRLDEEKEALAAVRAAQEVAEVAATAARNVAQAFVEVFTQLEPTLQYPIATSFAEDLINLRFRLSNDKIVNHTFNRNEPLSSVIQQIKYDLKSSAPISLTIYPRTVISCTPDTPIHVCGIQNRSTILVVD
jgi:hypothetical protein